MMQATIEDVVVAVNLMLANYPRRFEGQKYAVFMKAEYYDQIVKEAESSLKYVDSNPFRCSQINGAEIHICNDIDEDFVCIPYVYGRSQSRVVDAMPCKEMTPRHTCGVLDKDDHTYPCLDLMKNDQCPIGNRRCQVCGRIIRKGRPSFSGHIPLEYLPKGTVPTYTIRGVPCVGIGTLCLDCRTKEIV